MKEFKGTKEELAIALTDYINLKKSQEECAGFIDGFESAMKLPIMEAATDLLEACVRLIQWSDSIGKTSEFGIIRLAINKALGTN